MLNDHQLLTRTFELAALTNRDITAHAELTLVRVLQQQNDLDLLGEGTFFASCEPCPMCVGAMFWGGARKVVYGISGARLTQLATPVGGESTGFTVTALEIGLAATPPMVFQGAATRG